MILLHSGKQRAEVGCRRRGCLFSLKSGAGFGFIRVTQTRPRAIFTLALVLLEKANWRLSPAGTSANRSLTR